MVNQVRKTVPIVLFILVSVTAYTQQELSLNGDWLFRKAGTQDKWMRASVPGSVHTDLQSNGLIADPYLSCNNLYLAWVDSADWEYLKSFNLQNFSRHEVYELNFDGLDTYADVYLNGTLILKADNMFRKYRVSCTKHLQKGQNELRIVFRSAARLSDSIARLKPYRLPGGDWAYTRKAAYHFGWDWGPRFVTCGIWQQVYLRVKPKVYIENFAISTIAANAETATLAVDFDLVGTVKSHLNLVISNAEGGNVYHNVHLKPTRSEVTEKFSISHPKLWWPNGIGEQTLYRFRVKVFDGKNLVYDKVHKVGIRTARLVSEPDSIGQSFYFEVNGKPVFAKGANLIPPDFFVHRIPDSCWINLARQASQCNFNMIRVWGGGVYAPDAFMEECTRLGIMVWHDFMFACSMYPFGNDFFSSVEVEATEQVKRLRKHTSLVLWCGNNEVDEGWYNWGWSSQLAAYPALADSVWNGYLNLFSGLLPAVVQRYDPMRSYWPSSPMHGWGRPQSMTHGDSHYWGVWWGREPFESYAQKVPRFMSEYGFQGAPSEQVLKMFNDGISLPDSLQLKCHQKHPVGYETINEFLDSEGFQPNNLTEWTAFSQLVQAQAYAHAIESHRLASPYCMGTLYWQLNDCWPVVSWSGIDYLGSWKRVQHFVQNLYKPVIAGALLTDSIAVIRAVSDHVQPVQTTISANIMDINGKLIHQLIQKITLYPNHAVEVCRLILNREILSRNDIYLKIKVEAESELCFENVYYFTKTPHSAILNTGGTVQRIRRISNE